MLSSLRDSEGNEVKVGDLVIIKLLEYHHGSEDQWQYTINYGILASINSRDIATILTDRSGHTISYNRTYITLAQKTK